jgi:hypothetical protein
MQIETSTIETVVTNLPFDMPLELNNVSFRVFADSPKEINEFEARLAAALFKADGGEELDAYLDLLVDLVDQRYRFQPLVRADGVWEATYSITPGEETRLWA